MGKERNHRYQKNVVFEVFDCTDDPNNISAGLFASMKGAVDAAIDHPPTGIGEDIDRLYVIKPRAFGFKVKFPARFEFVRWKQVCDEDGNMLFVLNTSFKLKTETQPEAHPVFPRKFSF